jgi:hypothetical protein
MDFRSFINTSLHQHVIVAAPHIPLWKRGIDQCLVKKGMEDLFLIVITPSGEAAYCPVTGGTFFSIGKVHCRDVFSGAVVLAALRKTETFMGGVFSIVDVFSYNSIHVLKMPYSQRFAFARCVIDIVEFPSRYKLESAVHDMLSIDRNQYDTFGIYT